jgi:putative membrane protein
MNIQLRSAAIGLVGTLAAVSVHAQPLADSRDDWHMGWGYGHMVFGSLMMLLFWGAVVVAIVVAVRWIGGQDHRSQPQSSESRALAILEERFARGEIDKDEFEDRKRSLSG